MKLSHCRSLHCLTTIATVGTLSFSTSAIAASFQNAYFALEPDSQANRIDTLLQHSQATTLINFSDLFTQGLAAGIDLKTLFESGVMDSNVINSSMVTPSGFMVAQEDNAQASSQKAFVPLHPHQSLMVAQEDNTPASSQETFIPLHRRQEDRHSFRPSALFVPDIVQQTGARSAYKTSPGITIGIPSAYGAYWRTGGVGIGVQERARFTDSADGGIGLVLGVGNPAETVGLQLGIGFVDVSDPFADGTVSFKLHRQLPGDVAIALGATNVLTFGEPDGGSSGFGVVTKRFRLKDSPRKLFSELTTSIGVGGGQFRSEAAIDEDRETVGVFGSVALRIADPLTGIVEWTGQDLTLGISFVPFRNIGLSITPAVTDITGTAGNGPRFIAGVGYTFFF